MNTITGTTGLTALLGSPVSHSISPLMHNTSFDLLGLDYVYLCFDVKEDALEDVVKGLTRCHIRGFNLTMPLKNRIVPLLDSLATEAQLIGAVNTVVVDENGRMTGHNTDGIGFVRSALDAGCSIAGTKIVLMGAGGAATAICAQLALSGASEIHQFVRSSSRFYGRALDLVQKINDTLPCRAFLHDHEQTEELAVELARCSLLINATSVGMAPDTEKSILPDSSLLHKDLTVADIIYNPRKTLLLRQAEEAGCSVFNGMYMLLYQGAEAFRLWTGQEMPVEEIKERYFR